MKKIAKIIAVLGAVILVAIMAWYTQPSSVIEPITTPVTNKIFTISLVPDGTTGMVLINLKNISASVHHLGWDRYTRAKLVGRFVFTVKDSNLQIVPMTKLGLEIYTPEHHGLFPLERAGSWANIEIDPEETQQFTVNLANLFDLKSSSSYNIQATLNPSVAGDDVLSAQSDVINIMVKSTLTGPTLAARDHHHKLMDTYTEF